VPENYISLEFLYYRKPFYKKTFAIEQLSKNVTITKISVFSSTRFAFFLFISIEE